MATCPLSGKAADDLIFCRRDSIDRSLCGVCPARSWRLVFWWLRRHLWPLAIILAVSCALLPRPAAAAHDPKHNCPTMIAEAIAQGLMGGVFGQRADGMVTWTDGLYFCVFESGEAKTLFKASASAAYWARDLAKNAGKVITQPEAQGIIGTPRGTGAGIGPLLVPWAVVDPSCWQYTARGAVNVCAYPQGQRW